LKNSKFKKRRCLGRKRKCIHCKELFIPDHRNAYHQRYCTKPDCAKASKAASQHKWLSSNKGDYFKDPWHTERVREWRKRNIPKSKQTSQTRPKVLQDVLTSQNTENQTLKSNFVLQDLCTLQPLLLIGLIANLTGNLLQDDIEKCAHRFIDSGKDILNQNNNHKRSG
jgi:hypothetical protein